MKKNFLSTMLLIGIFFSLFTQPGCVSNNDPVVMAKKQTMMQNKTVNENEAKFLIEMADARMMDSKEGELAVDKGTRSEIRSYGQLMITDQARLLEAIQSLASRESIVLPANISNAKADGLTDLQKLNGEKFDQKFISMIMIDHKRDVKQFRMAADDPEKFSPQINAFAREHLSLIESHLDKVNAIAK